MKIWDTNCTVTKSGEAGFCASQLLYSMQEYGMERAFLCCDDVYAAVHNAEGNAYIREIFERWPDAFSGMATVNPWFGDDAQAELELCLKQGFAGVFFKPTIQGFMANDPMIYPFVSLCQKYGAPVYFHMATPMQALPFQVMALAKRFPQVNFIIGHMGANDYIGDALAAARMCGNVYLETSLNMTATLRNAARQLAGKMLFGSAAPESLQGFELEKLRNAVPEEEALEKILCDNAQKLWGGKI